MTNAIHVYVNATQISVRRQSGYWWNEKVESIGAWNWNSLVPSSLSFEPLHRRKNSREYLHVYLGSALCKFTTVDLPKGLNDIGEQQLAARAYMQNQLGLKASEWQFTIDFTSSDKVVVCAIRRVLIEKIQELSNESGFHLASIKPFVVGVWNTFQKNLDVSDANRTALVAIENDAFTVFVTRLGVLESMNAITHECDVLLVERESRRLSFSFTDAEQNNIYFAVPEKIIGTPQIHVDRILRKDKYLNKSSYIDFRDLVFSTAAE
ncbi:hypothetical protein [Undibacterium flavidum]|uniref:Uncharacterized protein n=1 Tax=Undibacterium flavidum TaxID=2762297 RepID=A0ABR6YBA2_9BURK|nr:hypothetical protein [Undibacterium flavidum]MBC3873831.1 hypothetical protein [Undibacterium flavidum]